MSGPVPADIPLTPNQHDLYLADQAADAPATYQISMVYRLDGSFDDTVLSARLAGLAGEHPILTSRLTTGPGGVVLRTGGPAPTVHHSAMAVEPDSPAARRRLLRERLRPLDPATGPMVRVVLMRYDATRADLIVLIHHLIADERSVELIARRLVTGEPGPAAPPFQEWALAQVTASATERAERIIALRAELAGTPSTRNSDTAGADTELRLSARTWESVTALAADLRVTPYSVMVAACGLVHARAHGGRTTVGAAVSRRTPRYAHTVGYFTSTIAVPLAPDRSATVADLIQWTHRRSMRAYRDADLPLSEVGAEGGTPRIVVVPVAPLPDLAAGETIGRPHPDEGLGTAQFPLTLYLHPADGGIRGLLRYQRAAVSTAAARRFCRQIEAVLARMLADPRAAVSGLSTLGTADEAWLLRAATGGSAPERSSTTIVAAFADQLRAGGDRIAVIAADTSLTYAELDARSSALALALAEAGARPGDRVGVCTRRGADLVVALLAVLKAGAAYVPLDPAHPAERLAYLVRNTRARVVIGDGARDIPGTPSIPVTASADGPHRFPAAGPQDIAYVIHTSGSTGQPKGVEISHGNVVALLAATRAEFALRPDDVWAGFHSVAFDFSVWEIWGCLLTGGRLVVVTDEQARDPEQFHDLLRAERVTVLSQTPSAFAQLTATAAFAGRELTVRLVVFGGESLDARSLLPWFDTYPERVCRCVNMYGITETTVHATWQSLRRADALAGSRSVGRPLPGWDLYVVDEAGRLAPPGVTGEIYVGGAGVAAGYLDRPDLTAERFVPDRITGADRMLYRSGDLGRYTDSGVLEHLGRRDEQIKLRGYRIELGEIRHALLTDPRVRAAAVAVRQPGDAATARIDAYVVAGDTDLDGIRAGLRRRLPAHMVPATVTTLAELPLTGNGKLDIARLPDPVISAPPRTAAPPATALGSIVTAWQEVIGRAVDPDDNFFELGGNSLLAVRLLDTLRTAGFGAVQLRDIFRHATPRRLDAALAGAARR